MTLGYSEQIWDSNAFSRSNIKARVISSNEFTEGIWEGSNIHAHSEQPQPLELGCSTCTNFRDAVITHLCPGLLDSPRKDNEVSWDHCDMASVILNGICFGALGAQPEVPHRVRVLGFFAFRVGLVKTEDSTPPILERGRTVRVCTSQDHLDFPCGAFRKGPRPHKDCISPAG